MALKDMGLVPLIIDIDDDIIKPLFAKEGDYRSRGILLQILNKGKEIDTSGVIVEFYAKPRDGKVYVVEATPVDATKGKYEIVYPSSILQPGIVQCEIRLVKMADDEIEEIITTKSFNLKVYETIADEDIFEGIDIEPIIEILVQAARNEEERIAAENERIQAENERIQAENERIQAENTRQSNENIRNSNEQTRQQNEAIRQQNEQDRIDLYNALKDLDVSQYELRLQKLEHDTSVEETVVEEAYGPVIPLPENVVNGQVGDVRIKGNTYTNLLGEDGDFSKGVGSWYSARSTISVENNQLKNVADGSGSWGACRYKTNIIAQEGKTYFIRLKVKVTNSLSSAIRIQVTDESFVGGIVKDIQSPVENHVYDVYVKGTITANLTGNLCLNIVHFYPDANTAKDKVMYIQDVMLVDLDQTGDADKTEEELIKKYPFINSTKSTFGAIRLKSVSEDETKESTLYVIAKDEEGNILELRSLPNGVKDEIDVVNRKLIKRIGEKANVSSGTVINYTDMAEGGTYYAWNENGETETGNKGDTLGIDATVLIYQLAEPEIIPVQITGSLQAYENGTMYIDAIIPRIDFYDINGIAVDVPIGTIDTLYKVDKETGYLYSLDISQAEISQDRLSFIHPDLVEGDLVDWDYVPDVESTNPAISMALPTNLKAQVNSNTSAISKLHKQIDNLNIRTNKNLEAINQELSFYQNAIDELEDYKYSIEPFIQADSNELIIKKSNSSYPYGINVSEDSLTLTAKQIFLDEFNLNDHVTRDITYYGTAVRDLSLTGVQTISLPPELGRPRSIIMFGNLFGTQMVCISMGDRAIYRTNDGIWYNAFNRNLIYGENNANRTEGQVTNMRVGAFDIDWTHVGNGAEGTARILYLAFFHRED